MTNTTTPIGIGVTGQVLSTSATTVGTLSGLSFTDTYANNAQSSLLVEGDAVVNGTLTVNGQTQPAVHERLERIEKMLKLPPVLRDNKLLEQKYKELENARKEYERLEQKYITWDNMKKDV